jgi:hypothetical protein
MKVVILWAKRFKSKEKEFPKSFCNPFIDKMHQKKVDVVIYLKFI